MVVHCSVRYVRGMQTELCSMSSQTKCDHRQLSQLLPCARRPPADLKLLCQLTQPHLKWIVRHGFRPPPPPTRPHPPSPSLTNERGRAMSSRTMIQDRQCLHVQRNRTGNVFTYNETGQAMSGNVFTYNETRRAMFSVAMKQDRQCLHVQ